jgi:polyhydroxyalkanoate synthesis regulator protein
MRRLPNTIYLTLDELDQIVKERQALADATDDGDKPRAILPDIVQLRTYAEAKRWVESRGLKPGA